MTTFDQLLPPSLRAQLPPLRYGGDDPMAYAALREPRSGCTWYPMEFDGHDTLYGIVDGAELEYRVWSLREWRSAMYTLGCEIERVPSFNPIRARALMRGLRLRRIFRLTSLFVRRTFRRFL
jgi:hypothetical protein